MSFSDLGFLINIYNIKNKTRYELQYYFGYVGGNAGKTINRFIELGFLKPNGGKKYNADNNKIIEILNDSKIMETLSLIVDDNEPTIEEKLIRKLRK